MRLHFWALPAVLLGSQDICFEFSEFEAISSNTKYSCGFPLEAAIEYLTGNTPILGACSMYSASRRFERYREWINALGGYVNAKVSFQRGYYVDPMTKKLQFSVGGLFLNPHEVLVPGESIFTVPKRAVFHEGMLLDELPELKKFDFWGSCHFWMSVGLAALLAHRPDVVGPWAALLPDMTFQPIMWPEKHIELLDGTPAYGEIRSWMSFISEGSAAFPHLLSLVNVTEIQVREAYSVILSRCFALQVVPAEEELAIPFGPDLLNHVPHTQSWIGTVNTNVVYYLEQFTLSANRELFNNYGEHSFSTSLAAYGFTSPNGVDQLVFIATRDDAWNGKVYFDFHEQCAFSLFHESSTCPTLNDEFDPDGSFRLVDSDYIDLTVFKCQLLKNDFMWKFIADQLAVRLVAVEESAYMLKLNGGHNYEMDHSQIVWMCLCAVPQHTPIDVVVHFVEELTTCSLDEEFSVSSHVLNIAKETLLGACKQFEATITNTLQYNINHWVAFRNVKRIKTLQKTIHQNIENTSYSTNDELIVLLKALMANSHAVFHSEDIDTLTSMHMRSSVTKADRMEEIYKYRLQLAYLLNRNCQIPLERNMASPGYRTLFTDTKE